MSSAGSPEDLLALARALVRVQGQPAPLDRDAAVLALRARAQTLTVVATIMGSIGTPGPAKSKAVSSNWRSEARIVLALLNQVDVAPAVALRALARTEAMLTRGVVPEPAITDLLSQRPSPGSDQPWHEVLARATAYSAALEAIADPTLPRRYEWELARDAAAITLMVSRLDRTLLPEAGSVLGPQVRRRLRGSISQNQLRTAAVLVGAAAAEHEPGTLPTQGWAISGAFSQPATNPPAQRPGTATEAFAEQLRAATTATPALVRRAAVAQLRALRLAEQILHTEPEFNELLQRAQPITGALAHVCGARHPQVLALPPHAAGQPGAATSAAVPEPALAGAVDSLLASIQAAQIRLRTDPGSASQLRDDAVQVYAAAPATVAALYDLAHAQLLRRHWASTVGPTEHYAQPYTRTDFAPPRLLVALAAAANAAYHANPEPAPTVNLKHAAQLCGVWEDQILHRSADLQRLGARAQPIGQERWSIPIDALRAVGLNPTTCVGPLSLSAAAAACGLDRRSLRQRGQDLYAAGATVTEVHTDSSSWRIPIPALLGIGMLPERLSLEPARTTAPPSPDAPSAAALLSNYSNPTAAHVGDLGDGHLEGPLVSRRRRREMKDRLGQPPPLGTAETDVLTRLMMFAPQPILGPALD